MFPDELKKKYNSLFDKQQKKLNQWREIARYVNPIRGRWLLSDDGDSAPPLLDSTSVLASRNFGSGIHGSVTNPTQQWFQLGSRKKTTQEEKQWIDAVERVIFSVFSYSNLYHVLPSVYEDLANFGTSAIFVDESYNDVVNFVPLATGTYACEVDTEGRPLALARKIVTPFVEAEAKFGSVFGEKKNEAVKINHLIEKDGDKYHGTYWASVQGKDKVLQEDVYDGCPVVVCRWDVGEGEAYGSGQPGEICVNECKRLQKMVEDYLEMVDLLAHPPLNVPVSLIGQKVDISPGAINYVPDINNNAVKPIGVFTQDPTFLIQTIQESREKIKEAFFSNLMLMFQNLDKGQQTAREIIERAAEKASMLGPVFQRTNRELLDPIIERTVQIASKNGVLPPVPDGSEMQFLDIEYESSLTRAQKMTDTSVIDQFLAFVSGVAGSDPTVLDVLDSEAIVKMYGDALGVSSNIYRDEAEVESIRQNRAAEMEQLKQAEQIKQTLSGLGQNNIAITEAMKHPENIQQMLGGQSNGEGTGYPE